MKRRQFIQMSVTGAAGLICPTAVRAADPLPWAVLASPQLLQILRDESVVADLGCRYRAIVPAENDAPALVQAILAELPAPSSSPHPARLQEKVRRDFAEGRTVTLNGWIVSVTEARQCALYSLLQA